MRLPGPLKEGVTKIETGLYLYRGIYIRFNRMEPLGTKWTSHYKKCHPVIDFINRGDSLRTVVNGVDYVFFDLAVDCGVDGFGSGD